MRCRMEDGFGETQKELEPKATKAVIWFVHETKWFNALWRSVEMRLPWSYPRVQRNSCWKRSAKSRVHVTEMFYCFTF